MRWRRACLGGRPTTGCLRAVVLAHSDPFPMRRACPRSRRAVPRRRGLLREATRSLATPAARDAMRTFLHEWMATDRLAYATKDSRFDPRFGSETAASMATELDRLFDQVLWAGGGRCANSSRPILSFADGTLASLYGVPTAGAGVPAGDARPAAPARHPRPRRLLAVHRTSTAPGPSRAASSS